LIKQDLKMQDIKSVLESLKPKDLINLGNLDAAIAKMIELNRLQNAKAPATDAAAKAAEAAAKAVEASAQLIPKNTTDFTLNNPTIFKLIDKMLPSNSYNEQLVTALNTGADLPSAVRGSNYQARAEQEYAAFLSQINMSGIAGQSLTSGMAQGLPLSNALSGSRYAAQGAASYGAGATIVVNTGVGDPEAIARAVEDVIRQANQRGTTSLSIG
jgi:glutamate synthase domain-containing protein 3